VTFTISGLAAVAAWLVADHGAVPSGWSAPPLEWLGGLVGVVVVVSMARAVPVLGVLQLALGVVAGQAAGALVIDLIAPAAGGSVTIRTVLSALLTVLAVVVSGMALGARRRPVPAP
jgi:bacterial/archaeal transporter family-2 protein